MERIKVLLKSIDANFLQGEIVVGLKSALEISSDFDTLFPELGNVEVLEIIELEVRTILILKLAEQTRQSVFDAMALLVDNPIVEYFRPNLLLDCRSCFTQADVEALATLIVG